MQQFSKNLHLMRMKKPRIHIGVLLLCFACAANAQNLIRNGGFEQHGAIECMSCYHLYGKYPAVVYHWDNGGWGCLLCDKNYKQSSDDIKHQSCPFDKIAPQEGKVMVNLCHAPGTNGRLGAADHLCARTEKPLEVGRLYEIGFWLYIPTTKRADPDMPRHIGIALLPQKVTFRAQLTATLDVPSLTVDTVVYDKWYPVKWRVRPLCTSNYLMIGLFATAHWPVSRSFADANYYIDQVTLTEIPSDTIAIDSSVYYCSRYEPQNQPGLTPVVDNVRLLFETNSADLTPEHRAVLDSFAGHAKKFPELVFEVSGHTDSIGSDNTLLSEKRVQSALRYLTEVCRLPDFRFIPLSQGSRQPVASNRDEPGRRLNRRVEIRQLNIDLGAVFYRLALQAVAENRPANAFAYLNKWLLKTAPGGGMILFFDPRFEGLHRDKRWVTLEQKIRDGYRKQKYPDYAFLIDSLRLDDLRVLGDLSWEFCALSPDSIPFTLPRMPQAMVEQKFREHFVGLSRIIEKIGWPKHSEFGNNTAASAFILLQHSLDSAAYVRWLPVLYDTCLEGEAPWMAYAMLYDRCQLIAGKPQRYATHVVALGNGRVRVEPYEGDETTINNHRARIGLPLLPEATVQAMRGEE